MGLKLRVTKEWLESFNEVMNYHRTLFPSSFRSEEIEECKQEARANEAWALEFYPKAAAIIREMRK